MTITLKPRQIDDLEFFRAHPQAALWHEVGVGKTHPTIFRMFELLDEKPSNVVVVVVKRSLFRAWIEKMTETAAGNPKWEAHARSVSVLTGGSKSVRPNSRVYLVNYDFFPKAAPVFAEFARQGMLVAFVLDEAQKIKGFRGFRSKKGVRARSIIEVSEKVPFRYALSGSPVLNPNSSDVWGIYYYLDNRIFGPTRWKFVQEFFYNLAMGQPYERLVLKPGMKEEMSRRMYLIARRLLKKDLPESEFPELNRIQYLVEMPDKVRERYEELKHKAITEIEGQEITRPMILARLMSLQQIASGFVIQEGVPYLIDASHKWEPVAETLEEIGVGEPVVVWAHFRHEIEYLHKQIKALGRTPIIAYGGMSRSLLEGAINGFQIGAYDTIIGHPQTAGAGLDLQRAAHALRFSRSYVLEDFEQSDGRINRAHSEHDVTTHHEYITENSRDEDVALALFSKQDLSRSITLDFVTEAVRHAPGGVILP